jgi:hypothetical protein
MAVMGGKMAERSLCHHLAGQEKEEGKTVVDPSYQRMRVGSVYREALQTLMGPGNPLSLEMAIG